MARRIRVPRKVTYWVLGIVIVGAALVGAYTWQHKKLQSSEANVTSLTTTLNQSKSIIAQQTSELNSLKQQKSSTTKYTSGAPCQTVQLSLSLHQNEGGAAGTGGALFAYQNNSSTSCTLNGYPGFLALDKDGHVVPNGPVQQSPMPSGGSIKTITLASGKDAFFRATWPLSSDGSGGQSGCIQPSLVLSVPPGSVYPLALAQDFSLTLCSAPGRTVSVTPVGQLTNFQ